MKLKYAYLFFAVLTAWIMLKSNSSGRTGATGSQLQSCSGGACHSNATGYTTTIDSLAIINRTTGLAVTQYTPGQSYLTIIMGRNMGLSASPGLFKYGFIVGNGGKGTFSGPTTNSTTTGGFWGHSSPKDSLVSMVTGPFRTTLFLDTCSWTAPSAGSGDVTFTAWLNAVNNNGGTSGDAANTTAVTKVIQELSNNAEVTIAAVGGSTICVGDSKTFNATPVNGGTAPTYQWYVNSSTVGTGGNSFTSSTLNNNDTVWVVMTSNKAGVGNNPDSSNRVVVTVSPTFTNNVTIVADKMSGCAGDTVTFTATPSTGSTFPIYRWFRNQTMVGGPSTSPTYKQIGLAAGDSFSCRLTVTNQCAKPPIDTSNYVKITVNNSPVITGHINDTICAGDSSKATDWMSTIGGTTYTWTNSNTNIGLAASGSGQIPKFETPSNFFGNQMTATITVNSFGAGCAGAPVTYNILITKKPSLRILNKEDHYCPGEGGTITLFPNPSFGTSVSWTNDNTTTGVAASGNNGFINFTATNTTSDSIVSNITATVTRGFCSKDSVFKIVVYPKPTVNAVASIVKCSGETVSAIPFSSPTTGVTYDWVNSDPSIGLAAMGSGDIASFTATNTGSTAKTGTIDVAAKYGTCQGGKTTFTITVNAPSPASVQINSGNLNPCPGENVLFTATPTNGGSAPVYEWYKNGILITGANKDTTTIMNVAENDTVVCKMVSNSSCVSNANAESNKFIIKTIDKIVPTIAITTLKDTICIGEALAFNTSITNGGASPTYSWFLNGSAISGATSDIFFSSSLNMDDIITCELTSSISCADPKKVLSNQKQIKVFAPVPTTISLTKSKNNICSDEYVTFTTTFTGGGLNPIVNWTLNGAQMNTNKKFITVPINSNFDVVELKVKSSFPCPNPPYPTLTASVDTVNQGPIVDVFPNKYIAFCEGDSIMVKAFNGQPNYSYKWSNDSSSESFWSYKSSSYTLTVTESGNICPRLYGPLTTSAQPLPFKPTVQRENRKLIASISDRYQWQLDELDIVGADSQIYNALIDGIYRVKVINNAGCVNYSDKISVSPSSITTGIVDKSINIYPNPSYGELIISSPNKEILEIQIFDLIGRSVYLESNIGHEKSIDLKHLPKGQYLFKLKTKIDMLQEKIELR